MKTLMLLLLSAGLAGPACADISDSGNLTIGGNGVIQGTTTVQGNAFSVGGATFTVSGGNVGIGTASPAATLDVNGSASFSGPVTFGAVSRSSATVDLSGRVTAAQTIYSVAAATLTFSIGGSNLVEVCYSGNLTTSGASNHAGWNFEVNGHFIMNLSATRGVASAFMPNSSESVNASACFPVPPGTLAGGSYSWLFVPACGNSCTLGGSSSPTSAYFWVKEDH